MKNISEVDMAVASPTLKHRVSLAQTGESYLCSDDESLLRGMVRVGRKGIPAGCLNGGCGVCKVQIRHGEIRKIGAMSRAHVSSEEEQQGVVLACRVAPMGDVELDIVGKMKKAFSDVDRFSASTFLESLRKS